MISLLSLPLLACIALALVHVYFGTFVLRRGVIFIDLALAQWAALGYLVGHWIGIHSPFFLFLMAVGFTIIASFILTIVKPLYNKINLQEGLIGAVYITAATLAIALITTTGMESHHLKDMLAGHLLFIQQTDIWIAYGLYTFIGILLLQWHHYFIHARSQMWDFIFYVLFGIVVTSSVKMVGILLVFAFLVLPPLSMVLVSSEFKKQVQYGWVIAILASGTGLFASLQIDIPPSYCIIITLCIIWVCFVIKMSLNQFRQQ